MPRTEGAGPWKAGRRGLGSEVVVEGLLEKSPAPCRSISPPCRKAEEAGPPTGVRARGVFLGEDGRRGPGGRHRAGTAWGALQGPHREGEPPAPYLGSRQVDVDSTGGIL